MSRTYRNYPQYFYKANGVIYTPEEHDKVVDLEIEQFKKEIALPNLPKGRWFYYNEITSWHWAGFYDYNIRGRDKKINDKPNHQFKQMKRRTERARVKNAIRAGKEIPLFKHSDQWDWT